MKKYIMTEQGLREVNPFKSPDGNYDQRSHYHAYENTVGYIPFPTGIIGEIYLESEIEFVEQYFFCGKWFDGRHELSPTRTIARLRTPQVSDDSPLIDALSKIINLLNGVPNEYAFEAVTIAEKAIHTAINGK